MSLIIHHFDVTDVYRCDGQSHVGRGRRNVVNQPTRPPVRGGTVRPIKRKNGTFTRRGVYIEK